LIYLIFFASRDDVPRTLAGRLHGAREATDKARHDQAGQFIARERRVWTEVETVGARGKGDAGKSHSNDFPAATGCAPNSTTVAAHGSRRGT
jgi:hypothetical protein